MTRSEPHLYSQDIDMAGGWHFHGGAPVRVYTIRAGAPVSIDLGDIGCSVGMSLTAAGAERVGRALLEAAAAQRAAAEGCEDAQPEDDVTDPEQLAERLGESL